jgi:hypothetical protein
LGFVCWAALAIWRQIAVAFQPRVRRKRPAALVVVPRYWPIG